MINNIKKPNLLICVFFSIIFNVDGRKTVLSTDNVYKIVNLIIGVYIIIINFHDKLFSSIGNDTLGEYFELPYFANFPFNRRISSVRP